MSTCRHLYTISNLTFDCMDTLYIYFFYLTNISQGLQNILLSYDWILPIRVYILMEKIR